MADTETLTQAERRLNRMEDRCDRCGAQAYYMARKIRNEEISELLFCTHHYKECAANLAEQEWHVFYDEDALR